MLQNLGQIPSQINTSNEHLSIAPPQSDSATVEGSGSVLRSFLPSFFLRESSQNPYWIPHLVVRSISALSPSFCHPFRINRQQQRHYNCAATCAWWLLIRWLCQLPVYLPSISRSGGCYFVARIILLRREVVINPVTRVQFQADFCFS